MDNLIDKPVKKVFFKNLDGLRSVAFLLVYLKHTFYLTFKNLIGYKPLERLVITITNGLTGVSVFFVLSGFLITYLLLTEKESRGRINILHFYLRRILRIWPLYYAVIFFAVNIFPYLKSHFGNNADLGLTPIYYYTFLSNFDAIRIIAKFGIIPQMMTGITWSVAIEEQFYLIWPLLFTVVPKKYYKYIFAAVILFCIAFRFTHRDSWPIIFYHSFSVCADLAVGGLAAFYSFNSAKFVSFFKNLSTQAIVLTYFLGFVWLLYGDIHITSEDIIPASRLVSIAFFAFIVLEQNYSNNSFFKFASSRVLTFWGKYTYGLYLLHPVAIWITMHALTEIFSIPRPDEILLPAILRDVTAFFLTLVLGYFSYEFFEKRFLRLKSAFSVVEQGNRNVQSTVAET